MSRLRSRANRTDFETEVQVNLAASVSDDADEEQRYVHHPVCGDSSIRHLTRAKEEAYSTFTRRERCGHLVGGGHLGL